jgi:hypothetical protein
MGKVHQEEHRELGNLRASLYKPGKNRCHQCGYRVQSIRHTEGIQHKRKAKRGK